MNSDKAYTRAVSPTLANCALTHLAPEPIDVAQAIEQHSRYEEALIASGLAIERLPELPNAPDGVFVEDTAIVLGDHAVVTRPGAASRAHETQSTAAALSKDFEVHHLAAGTLDGGDVLRIGRTLYVGLGGRSNAAGIAALKDVVEPLGYEVKGVEISGCLHLKTGATYAGCDRSGTPTLLLNPAWVPPTAFRDVEPLAIDPAEPFAANSLRIGDRLIIAAGAPATRDKLQARGFQLVELDISELEKAEAGLTCMSIIRD